MVTTRRDTGAIADLKPAFSMPAAIGAIAGMTLAGSLVGRGPHVLIIGALGAVAGWSVGSKINEAFPPPKTA